MKKLLALFIIGGLLSTITGCPPATSTSGPKKTGETKIESRKTGSGESKTEERKGPGGEMKTEEKKTEEKKTGTDKGGGTKTEEKKTEEKKK